VKYIALHIDGTNYYRLLPGSYADMTRKQAIATAKAYQLHQLPFGVSTDSEGQIIGYLSTDDRILLLKSLLNIPADDWFKIGDAGITSLLIDSPFAFDRENIITGHPVLKYVKIGLARHQLPAADLIDSPLVQFVWAEKYYKAIQEGGDIFENLNGLVSVLCSSKRRRWAMKLCTMLPFLGNLLIDWSKKRAHNVPIEVAFCLLQFYYGARQSIVHAYKPIFQRSSEPAGTGGPDLISRYEWWALVHDLAEKQVFGGFYATCYSNLHDSLHHVSYNADKIKEQTIKHTINA
jgi:hypothetical protein